MSRPRRFWPYVVSLLAVATVTLAYARLPLPVTPTSEASGLQFRLSEGRPATDGRVAGPLHPPTTRLTQSAVDGLLASLPPLPPAASERWEFRMRGKSLPPPRAGHTVSEAFPPPVPAPAGPPGAKAGALTVLRYSPDGPAGGSNVVPIAPQLSVTFSQPMVAVTSLGDLAAQDVPVQLTPQPPGKWRWIGTRTLVFEPAGNRFPMATRYHVVVPAGTRDTAGHALTKAVTWTFSTPAPQVKASSPNGGPQPREPVIVVVFDQKVDPAAVLARMQTAPAVPLALATDEDLKKDKIAKATSEGAEPSEGNAAAVGRAVAVRPLRPFPLDTAVTVTVGAGTPSLEGPLRTDAPQTFSFSTYGAMTVQESGCSNGDNCPPLSPWYVRFSNPVDAASFKPEMVAVSPALPDMKVDLNGHYIYIRGRSHGRTIYTVTLSTSIRDIFGQNLSASKPLAFHVGSALPSLAAQGGNFIVADPFAPPAYTVFTINEPSLHARLYSVTPDDWPAFVEYMRRFNQDVPRTPPGKLVQDITLPLRNTPDEPIETGLDLRPALHNGLGHVIALVEPTVQPKERWQRRYAVAWIESTRIGLDAFVDPNVMEVSATRLTDGQPMTGVHVSLSGKIVLQPGANAPSGAKPGDVTGSDGLATLWLPENGVPNRLLIARKDDDVAILPENKYWWNENDAWSRRPQRDALRWFVFDDRGIYKPNETVHLKGWLRIIGAGPKGDVRGLDGTVKSVHYRVLDSRGNEVGNGDAAVDAVGGFDTSFKLSDNVNLGTARVEFSAAAANLDITEHSLPFEVEEFRRPEFEVSASAPPGPYVIGDGANVTSEAKYYAGGPLGNAGVTWRVTSMPTNYSPPGHGEFTFGTWVPWFYFWSPTVNAGNRTQTFTSHTDAAGKHVLRIDFDGVHPPQPSSVTAEATVVDVNRQAWSSTATLLVHPSTEYVGLRRKQLFVQPGQAVDVDAIVTDIDGKMVSGRTIQLHAALLDYEYKDGQYRQLESHEENVTLTSGSTPVSAALHPHEGGTWRIRATVTDAKGRPNQSETMFWVSGGKQPPSRGVSAEKVLLVPDKEKYQPGDVAHILVSAPFGGGHGLYTLARSGLVETRIFALNGTSATIDVPIEESMLVGVNLNVSITGATERRNDDGKSDAKLARQPAYAVGSLFLSVPPLSRKLTVSVSPRDRFARPGTQTVVNVTVLDANGKPAANSEVAVVIADESVLALTHYKLDDPLNWFYAVRGGDVAAYHERADAVLANPLSVVSVGTAARPYSGMPGGNKPVMLNEFSPKVAPAPLGAVYKAAPGFARMSIEGAKKAPAPTVKMRSDFNALALFAPCVHTDASGQAVVSFKLPDSLTRYRVMAVAVADGKYFGSGDSNLTARLPLMVRPSAPRFLNFGDRCQLPVVLQNQTDRPMQVQVAARASNLDLLEDARSDAVSSLGYAVTVPANDRVEVLFPSATQEAGTTHIQIAARCGEASDAAEVSLPVYTPATTEAFATYGALDQNGSVAQPVQAPGNVFTQFGGLEVELSSTALQSLTDAVIYLVRYPFECAEQVSSRVIAVSALRDVLSAFHARDLPDAKSLNESVANDVDKLKSLQNDDGGFAFWRRGDTSWPFISVHVTNALVRAKEKGYDVPQDVLDRAHGYLRNVEAHYPSWYSEDVRNAISAYALNVRWRMGDRDVARAKAIIASALPPAQGDAPAKQALSVEAVGWLLPVLAQAEKSDPSTTQQVATLKRYLNNRVSETAGAASFNTDYGDGQYLLLASNRRADAVVLEGLIESDPRNDLIPKIVRGLQAHRSAGRWLNTQENVFVLLALDKYFNVFEKQTPSFSASLWLGDVYAGMHEFRGYSTDRAESKVPMSTVVAPPQMKDLIIDKQGVGRLYYRIGMQYAPRDLDLKPLDAGFTVQRVYEPVDDKDDVLHQSDGTWAIRAGARVRVRVTMVATSRRYHVALVDPLPAGLEALNPALAVQGALPTNNAPRKGPVWFWWRPWYEHQNLKDDRAEVFTSLLWDGVYEYTYYARATTPGSFEVPPPKAEEMYSPEVFGRGATARVVVK